MSEKLTLHQKLLEIQRSVSYLQKENKGYQFTYVSSSQTLGAIRSKMDELGVLLLVSSSINEVCDYPTKKGDIQKFTDLSMTFTWVNVDNPEDKISCPWYAQGVDSGEKGVGKALTYGEKYFLLKSFHIATDKDDPDSFQERTGQANNHQPATQPNSPGSGNGQKGTVATKAQLDKLHTVADILGIREPRERKLQYINAWIKKNNIDHPQIQSTSELSKAVVNKLIDAMDKAANKLTDEQTREEEGW